MLINSIKVFLRLLAKQRAYYTINIAGLAIALASCALILTYVNFEYSIDSFHTNSERIYRIATKQARTPAPLVPALQTAIPEIESATRLIFTTSGTKAVVKDKDGNLFEENLYFVDSTFFQVFSYGVSLWTDLLRKTAT